MDELTTVEIDSIDQVTDQAVLVTIDGEQIWLPRSCITDGEEIAREDERDELEIATWLARKHGLL